MAKIFISYRRKSWAFTHRLSDELARRLDADIFVDIDGIDDDDFERGILSHLRVSDVVLLVISETTFADRIHKDDDWVRREIREALELEIPIVLVAIEGRYPPSDLPEDIKAIARKQGIPFYSDYWTPACDKLADFVVKIGAADYLTELAPELPTPIPASKKIKGQSSLYEALALLDTEDFDKGIFILEQLVEQNFKARRFDVQAILNEAYAEQETAERRRIAHLDYEEIVAFARSRFTQNQAQQEWQQWCTDYPNLVAELDTENLREKLQKSAAPPAKKKSSQPSFTLPEPFAWVDIPAGQVTLEDNKGTFAVPAFQIAKYPVTVAQYELFMNEDGYQNNAYWTQTGWQWREKENITLPEYWNNEEYQSLWQPDHPMVGVSWYEAYAFSQWLSAKTGSSVTLPTEQQWQRAARAAQGDDGHKYPWGNDWDSVRCNNDVDGKDWKKKKAAGTMTSPVLKYAGQGDSPFDAVDMAGNVWEWCLTDYDTAGNNDIENINNGRVLRGGSWHLNSTYYFRCAFRGRNYPNDQDFDIGFRLALS